MEVSFCFIHCISLMYRLVTDDCMRARSANFCLISCTGQEVALWVKENFKKELVKLQSFKSKCYKEALEECFFKMDVLMQSPAGQSRLKALQGD